MSMTTALFVIVVVAIGCATSVVSDYLKTRRKELENRGADGEYDSKIQELEERIRVLERIVTESKHDLRREINEL